MVSIPYRYGTTCNHSSFATSVSRCQFLIGMVRPKWNACNTEIVVSIPYRYGTTMMLSEFLMTHRSVNSL